MRVLLINPEFPPIGGGAGNAAFHLARELAALGPDVTVLTARFGDLPREERRENVRVLRLAALRRSADRSGALEQGAFLIVATLAALQLTRRDRPDVTLAFFGVPSGPAGLALRALFRIPYVVSLRGGDVPGFRPYDFKRYHQMIAPLLRVVWRRAAALVANSRGLRDLARTFAPDLDVQIIPNGVDAARFFPGQRPPGPARLLTVGRVVHQKGVDLTLRALAGLRDLEWTFEVVGDGPQRAALQDLARELGIADRVTFAGWKPNTDLPDLYRRADLFVFPSRHEGMPNVVLEAMASGLPVVASAIAGNEELVLPEQTGLLVPPGDVEALRLALRRLVPDADLRARLGAAGRDRVEREFSWRATAQAYLVLLERAVGAG